MKNNLNFVTALALLLEGKKVANELMEEGTYVELHYPDPETGGTTLPYFVLGFNGENFRAIWEPTSHEILLDSWEEVVFVDLNTTTKEEEEEEPIIKLLGIGEVSDGITLAVLKDTSVGQVFAVNALTTEGLIFTSPFSDHTMELKKYPSAEEMMSGVPEKEKQP